MKIAGKKLLVLGGVAMICELVKNAQHRGAYVIVADYYPDSPAKRIADEAWLVSTADTEKLAQMCKEAHVDGVISAFDDFNIICAQHLSERIGAPFYATREQVETTMDKMRFKALCRKNHVPSTPEFQLDKELSRACLDQIEYPVIMKPTDSSGARGITICRNEEELRQAYQLAMKTSKKGEVILEKYLVGDEIGVNYILQDGEIHVSVLHDRYMQEGNGQHVRLPVAYVYPSKYTKQYLEQEDKLVVDMFRSIGMSNGTLFLQGCVDQGTCYFYEMGYRLNGAKQYQLLNKLCHFNPMEMIVNYSLTGKEADESITPQINPMLGMACCTLSVLARPARIAKIIGLDEIEHFPETVAITQWYQEGDEIAAEALGTQKQICMRITVAAENMEKLAQCIQRVYHTLQVLDEAGESILLEQFDTNRLFEGVSKS
jgi:carbamoylphosphate synthase large subunit